MAEINLEILDAAFDDGFFKKPLTQRQKLYLSPSVGTAWEVLKLVGDRAENGVVIEAIAQNLNLNKNTVRIYCRWLREKGLVESFLSGGRGGVLAYFLPTKSRSQTTRSPGWTSTLHPPGLS
jgi:predicted transcriptional regulator